MLMDKISYVYKLFLCVLVTIVVVISIAAMVVWGRPIKMSDTKEISKIENAIEVTDSVDSINIFNISNLSEMKDFNGNVVNCQTVYYSVDSVNKVKFIKVKKGFLKYKFDGIFN